MPRATTSRPQGTKPYDRESKATTKYEGDPLPLVSEDEKPDVTDTDNVTDHDSPADGNFEDHNYEDDDLKPDVTHKGKGKKTAKAKTPKATPKKAATPRKNAGASPRKPMAWTPEEDWALFSAVHPKIEKPAWDAVAAAVGGGRDGKSCSNRYYVWYKAHKLETAIKNMSNSS